MRLAWYTNMAAVSLFRNTNMAAMTSCENALLPYLASVQSVRILTCSAYFGHFRNKKITGIEMHLAIVSGIVTGDTPVCYWPIGWVICKKRS